MADEGRPGLSRRNLIKAAGVAGAVAWTAPVIIDSLSSPAAAVTAPTGCFLMYANLLVNPAWGPWSTTNNSGTTCMPPAPCNPTTSTAAAAALGTPTPAPANTSSTPVTVSVNSGYSCTIVAAGAVVRNGFAGAQSCRSNTAPGGTTFTGLPSGSVTITPTGNAFGGDVWDNEDIFHPRSVIVIVLQCG
jgi:hypothetical protein